MAREPLLLQVHMTRVGPRDTPIEMKLIWSDGRKTYRLVAGGLGLLATIVLWTTGVA
jgi:hypothetical protein